MIETIWVLSSENVYLKKNWNGPGIQPVNVKLSYYNGNKLRTSSGSKFFRGRLYSSFKAKKKRT